MIKCKYCNRKLILDSSNNYYCKECDLLFRNDEIVLSRRDLIRKPELSRDPYFFQYVTTKELLDCLTIELLKYLSLARKAQRDLHERVFRKKEYVDSLDRENLTMAKRTIHKIETILIERNGYIPAAIYQSTIEKENRRILKEQENFIARKE